MKTVVLSLGGSILIPELAKNRISAYLPVLKEIAALHRVFVVVGGGGGARDYITVARKLGIDEGTADEIGILVTRLNAMLLIAALGDAAYPKVAESHSEAKKFAESKKIVVMGGITPGQTTDAVAAVLAERVQADIFVNVTSVNGIYDKDPKSHPGARHHKTLSPQQLLEIVGQGGLGAGSHNVLDIIAARIVERSSIPLVVLDGTKPKNLSDVLLRGNGDYSVVSSTKKKVVPL